MVSLPPTCVPFAYSFPIRADFVSLDLPPSPFHLLQIALLGPSSTFLPARLQTLRQSLLQLRNPSGGYKYLIERFGEYLTRWEKVDGLEPRYRERRYLIAEREPRKRVDKERMAGRVIWTRNSRDVGHIEKLGYTAHEVWVRKSEYELTVGSDPSQRMERWN